MSIYEIPEAISVLSYFPLRQILLESLRACFWSISVSASSRNKHHDVIYEWISWALGESYTSGNILLMQLGLFFQRFVGLITDFRLHLMSYNVTTAGSYKR